MAKKKSPTLSAAPKKKAATKKAAPKKAAPKKKASAETATKSLTPKATKAKAAAPKAAAPKKTAVKKAAAVKITDKQRELLTKVHGAGETGYTPSQKAEVRSLDALKDKKLLKTGKKDKATGMSPYMSTKAGAKVLTTAS